MIIIRNILLTLLATSVMSGPALALDPPHDSSRSIECVTCHTLHTAPGGTLTAVAGNANLCQSCHVTGGTATTKPFVEADQARPGLALPAGMNGSGTSHRWDAGPQGRVEADSGNTSSGTMQSAGAYTGPNIQTYTILITTPGDTGVAQFEWYLQLKASGAPAGPEGTGTSGTDVPLGDGLTLTFTDGVSSPSFAAGDAWYLYVVADTVAPTDPEMLARLENDAIMCSTCHDQHSQEMTPFDPATPPTPGDEGRHNQRLANDTDQMCKDCHSPRDVNLSSLGSHPVGVGIPVSSDYQSPTGLPLDASGNVSCLTCHDMHYNGTDNGLLLRINDNQTMCTECHTLASGVASHFNTSAAEMWPGGQYGSSFPAISDTGKTASCGNCHYPHGWPDSAAPASDNPLLAVDFEEAQCYTCHDGDPATADVHTDFQKASAHPLATTSAVHQPGEASVVNSASRHVECNDCHNPHEAEASVSVPGPSTSRRLASGPLEGVQGVNVAGGTVATATYEYEVCFRCHADSTGKPAAPTPQREFPETNVRIEFNGSKASYHPVTTNNASADTMPSLINGWAANSIMSCTNCHNSDSGPAAGGAGPNGAHGSTWPSLLEKQYVNADPSPYVEEKYAACFSCHDAASILSDDNNSFGKHDKHIRGADTACNVCHDPHASGNDRLINFDTSVVTSAGGMGIDFTWNGPGSGSCTLTCHDKNHMNKSY